MKGETPAERELRGRLFSRKKTQPERKKARPSQTASSVLLFTEPSGAKIVCVPCARPSRVALYKGETEAQGGQEMSKAQGGAQSNTHASLSLIPSPTPRHTHLGSQSPGLWTSVPFPTETSEETVGGPGRLPNNSLKADEAD